LDFLNSSGREFLLIATKSDRLSNNQLRNHLKALAEAYPTARVIAFSSKTSAGREEVWNKIRQSAAEFSRGRVPILNFSRSGNPAGPFGATSFDFRRELQGEAS
jgi:hypothetical protein